MAYTTERPVKVRKKADADRMKIIILVAPKWKYVFEHIQIKKTHINLLSKSVDTLRCINRQQSPIWEDVGWSKSEQITL